MLYQPNFCCQCGTKIERIEWKLWTSRKFCEDCEKDFRKQEWIPRVIAGIMVLFGIFGFGSYLKTPEKPLNAANQIALSSNKTPNPRNESNPSNNSVQNTEINQNSAVNKDLPSKPKPKPQNLTPSSSKSNETVNSPVPVTETLYYCGAQTKKGTPCTRKVKGGGRCWQHIGQPSILPKEKLVVGK